jgi:phosphoenolpyruvate---glycerone phosphotransferase subunit DhaK
MKKLINSSDTYVDDALAGMVAANPDMVLAGEGGRVVRRAGDPAPSKVGIASGGGSGHLPLFAGYVGEGLLDTCSVGNVFEGPNLASCIDAIRMADAGAGVLVLFGNYGGDRMNFSMAVEMLEDEGIRTRTVLGTDDIASAPPEESGKRRGVAGLIYAYKVAGAAAAAGLELDEVTRLAQKAVDHTRTIGVALRSCHVPGASAPNFVIEDDEVEMGMGIHGEPGIWRGKLKPAHALAEEMVDRLIAELGQVPGQAVGVLVNGLGATPLDELFILYGEVARRIEAAGMRIRRPMVGNYVTSMEMAGTSISLIAIDDELEPLLAAPANCPFWKV